ncbi:hypothetical protein SAY87_015818 [Trapa incisa]|uniref:Mechanosensitive ion channel protein n=1 Tax=Trapa incisa TaxID=236973 RepID=A0AAN7L4Y2_9MYRT|nr:hypothetical protein SAY87_015810 [Trapa incisa]KAK4779712.1 hypothetical protein SAY87_015818 [Trapa incisa]
MRRAENRSSAKGNGMPKVDDSDNLLWSRASFESWRGDGTSRGVPEQRCYGSEGGGDGGREEPQRAMNGRPSRRELHQRLQGSGGFFSFEMDSSMQRQQQEEEVSNAERITLSQILEWPSMIQSGFSRTENDRQAARVQGSYSKGEDGQAMGCTSSAAMPHSTTSSFKRPSTIQTNKNVSRLLEPPEQKRPSPGPRPDDEEDDPFLEEDCPQNYKNAKISVLTLLESLTLLLIIAALICSLTVPYIKLKRLWHLELWKWEVLVPVLICGRLVSSWGIRVIVFFIERNFLLRKRVLYFVYGLRKSVQNSIWLGLVLITWHLLFDENVQKATRSQQLQYVSKALVCLLVGTLIWLVKTLIVKVLASSFHVNNYFDRIQESLFNQYVMETLTGPPLIEMRKLEEEDEKMVIEVQKLLKAGVTIIPPIIEEAAATAPLRSGISTRAIGAGIMGKRPVGDDEITIDHLHRLSPRNISAWNMKRLMNLICYGNLTTLDEQITGQDNVSTKEISSELEAMAAARNLFYNVARPGSNYIYIEDLMRFMPEDEALMTLNLFDGASESHRITKSALKNWVVNAFRDRRALALSLDDTKTAVKKLHQIVNIIVRVLVLIVWLLILGLITGKFLVLISSQILLVVFMFGNSCKTAFECIIFLFVMHPFDVGDRCEIDGVEMIVEEMNILTTVFLRSDNLKIIYPNSQLAIKCIHNHRRSPDMGDFVEFFIHISTPPETIAAMKQRITSYIESKSEHWCPGPMIVLIDFEKLNKLKFQVWLTRRTNHQDMTEKYTRKELLMEEMVNIFKELDIQYRLRRASLPVIPNNNPQPHLPFWTATSSSG